MQQDVVDYEELRTHRLPALTDAALGRTTSARRNRNIFKAVKRGDPVLLKLPEVARVVHTRKQDLFGVHSIDYHYNRYRRACSELSYAEFRELAAEFGIDLPYGTPSRKRTRRARILAAHDRNRRAMDVLLFAYEYCYDPHQLSVAVNRARPSTPVLHRVREAQQLPLAA